MWEMETIVAAMVVTANMTSRDDMTRGRGLYDTVGRTMNIKV